MLTLRKNIVITNYLPSKNKIVPANIKEKVKVFSDWIDYWAIDYDNKNQAFNNMWISYRTPKKRKLKLKSDPFYYEKPGVYNLSIKVIDILGTVLVKSCRIKV